MPDVEFSTALVATARKYRNARESAGPNTDNGGFIDQCLAAIGGHPGQSWCAAAVSAFVKETAEQMGIKVNFHPSLSALRMLSKNPDLVVTDPQPGDIVIWDHTVDPAKPAGHVGILTDVVRVDGQVAGMEAIAGNTSPDGKSREGTGVFEHAVDYPNPKIAGYLRIA
jgi:hypothetical protein